MCSSDLVGINADPYRAVLRASEELQEALEEIAAGRNEDAGVELADVVICLHVAASKIGVNLQDAIDAKIWRIDETGCAYHVK